MESEGGVADGDAGVLAEISLLAGDSFSEDTDEQVPSFFPGGREVGALDVGGAGVAERPSVSGSERSSALGGVVAAGGGVTGSPLLSSTLPGVAVHGVSASTSGIAAPAGAAASGVSAVRSTDPGSSSSQVSAVGARSSSRGFADASSFMDPGQEGIWEMLRLSVAASTWSHYNLGFRTVAAFLAARGWCPGDVSESLLADFVLSSFRAQVSRGVVRGRLAGFAFFCRALGWACPMSCFLVQRMLRAMHRVHPSLPDSRLPITHELLLRLLEALSVVASSAYEAGLFRAAFVTAFFGALRVSELLVCPSARLGFRGLLVSHRNNLEQCSTTCISRLQGSRAGLEVYVNWFWLPCGNAAQQLTVAIVSGPLPPRKSQAEREAAIRLVQDFPVQLRRQ
uniref:Uncharacterized protein LOC117365465 n=1 Tax=Geotrypetes seraphini TaxID=260995 RepID=A0A6P8S3I3_GEOSA|nr:uncharacterized protein LOC117365465 [Geotrypetes seraphini]